MAERTVTLADERDRLAERHDELEQLLEEADDPHGDAAKPIRYQRNQIGLQGRDLNELIEGDDEEDGFDGYGPDATVTVRSLTAGEKKRVKDRVRSQRNQRRDLDSVEGYHSIVYAAVGVRDAPFLPDGLDDLPTREAIDKKIEAVANLEQSAVADWLYNLVDDVDTPAEGNWKQSSEEPADTSPDSTTTSSSGTSSASD